MEERQYLKCAFRPQDTRLYTYHWDGPPFLVTGDQAKAPDRTGEGWRRVFIREISFKKPPFETKALLGRALPDEEPPAKAAKPGPAPAATRDLFS